MAREAKADAVLHVGDLGFYDDDSVERLEGRELFLRVVHSDLPPEAMERAKKLRGAAMHAFIRERLPLSDLVSWLREGRGKVRATAKQLEPLLDATPAREPGEVCVPVTHVSPGKVPLVGLLAAALDADLTVSGHMGSPLGCVWDDFAVREPREAELRLASAEAALFSFGHRVEAQVALARLPSRQIRVTRRPTCGPSWRSPWARWERTG